MGKHGGRVWPLLPIDGAVGGGRFRCATTCAASRIVDDSTLAFTLTQPLNIFPKLLAMPVAAIVPTPVPDDFGEAPIGSGPWKFVSWSHDDLLVFARNDHWWGPVARADTLRVRIIPEVFTAGRRIRIGAPVGGRGSRRRNRAMGTRPRRRTAATHGDPRVVRRHQHPARRARRRARAPGAQSRGQYPGDPRAGDAQPRRRSPPAAFRPGSMATTRPAPATATTPRWPAACSPKPATRRTCICNSGARRAPSSRASPRRSRPTSAGSA